MGIDNLTNEQKEIAYLLILDNEKAEKMISKFDTEERLRIREFACEYQLTLSNKELDECEDYEE